MTTGPATARAIAAAVRDGSLSARAVVDDALARLDAQAGLNAVVHRLDDAARAAAAAVDAARARGAAPGPLAGVPVAIKDNLCTTDAPTTAGSRVLAGFVPPYDATAVSRLRAAGAIVVAKTNCDEFGMGSSNENSAYGPVAHPTHPGHVPGGSSGGSAAAVAAGLVPLALGSDTGGSVRQPAAFCGIVGVKPTYGRVSRHGLVAFGSSLDHVGPFARDVRDAALALSVIAGHDPADATSADRPVPPLVPPEVPDVRGLRVGRLARFLDDAGLDEAAREATAAAAAAFADAGATLVDVDLPLAPYGIPVYYVLATAEASSNLARYDGVRFGARAPGAADLRGLYEATRGAGFGAEVKRRIMLGTFVLSAGYHDAYYAKAQAARERLRAQLDRAFGDVDLLLLPTAPGPAFRAGEKVDDPLAMYLSDVFTVLANLGGHPALSIPAPRPAGALPLGVQLMAARFAEPRLLEAAAALEERGFRTP